MSVFCSSSQRGEKNWRLDEQKGEGCPISRFPLLYNLYPAWQTAPKNDGKIHHFQWVNPRTKSLFSIAILNYQRVYFWETSIKTATNTGGSRTDISLLFWGEGVGLLHLTEFSEVLFLLPQLK
jgi:hypothetical protein